MYDLDLFQQICKFTNKFNVYLKYDESNEIYDIKLRKISNNEHNYEENIMAGKLYLNNDKKGNFIAYKNSRYILVLN